MELALDYFVSITSSVIFFFIGVFSRKIVTLINFRQFRRFIGDHREVLIVIPSMLVASFPKNSIAERAIIPVNIALMPMNEGKAIVNVASLINRTNPNVEIKYVSNEHFVDTGSPVVVIGGPSVNSLSNKILKKYFPKFQLIYPDHFAIYKDKEFRPVIENREVTEDFGFVFSGVTRTGTPFLLLCGVWASGTEAASMFLKSGSLGHNFSRRWRKFSETMVCLTILSVSVEKYRVGNPNIVSFEREIGSGATSARS